MSIIQNPVIPGYHPDPSICRAGDVFYLVTSSFEYFPGVPIFTSRNLTDWRLLGHCLTRASQLPLQRCEVSDGIYAPTIRYHDGTFFMVTTNVSGGGNFIVHTENPAGSWSEPVWVRQGGIDPSLLFDGDAVYFVSNGDCSGNSGIYLCEVDPFTGRMLTDSTLISRGCGGKYPEAPHLYHIGDYYYLMLAEGGTEYGHMVTMQRSLSPYGPYAPCPHNPILSNRDEPAGIHNIACTGHADLIEDPHGRWWLTALGVRTLCTRKNRVLLHNLGRETFLAPVSWQDGWPIAGDGGILRMCHEAVLPAPQACGADCVKAPLLKEDFSESAWNPEFTFLRNPRPELYGREPGKKRLILHGSDSICTPLISPALTGVRQNAFCQRACVTVDGVADAPDAFAGLSVYYTNEHHYDAGITWKDGRRYVRLRRQIYDLIADTALISAPEGPITLEVISGREKYTFRFIAADGSGTLLGTGAAAALCTEVTRRMTFTGTFFCMFSEHTDAQFTDFIRETLPDPDIHI